MSWLTPDRARKWNLPYELLTPSGIQHVYPETSPPPAIANSSPPQTNSPSPPQTNGSTEAPVQRQKSARLVTTEKLNLRIQPDPHADRVVLGSPPDDVIPIAATVELGGLDVSTNCRTYDVTGMGHSVWCRVVYENHDGWVNSYYLDTGKGRFSCLIDQSSLGCDQVQQISPEKAVARTLSGATIHYRPDQKADKVLDQIPSDVLVEFLEQGSFPFGCRKDDKSTTVAWCPVSYNNHWAG